VRFVTVLFYFN